VDVSRIAWTPDGRLGTFFAEESPAPLGPQVIYDRAGSAFARLDPESFDLEPVRRTRLLHLTGITPALGPGPHAVFDRAAEIAEQAGVPISFDVNYRAKLWTADEAAKGLDGICRRARVLICASGDAATLWGFQGEPEAILDAMAARFGGSSEKTIVLTLGADGSAMRDGNGFRHAPALSTSGRERFGSGDAFGAGFLAAWLGIGPLASLVEEGFSPLACGNAMAALKRCIAGDIAIVTPGEVERLLRTADQGYFR
jgi:2-dehydro-3-deoxygluconokinase